MPLVSQSIHSFKGGVSQQPDIIRFPDQVTELVNGFSTEEASDSRNQTFV